MKLLLQVVLLLFLAHPLSLSANDLFGKVDVKYGDEIDKKTRSDIQALNGKILQSFSSNSPAIMFDMFSAQMKENGIASIEKLYQKSAEQIAKKKFQQSHEFLALHTGGGEKTSPITSQTDPEFLTYITLLPGTPKYVSIMESANEVQDLVLFFIYEQVDSKWSLNTFQAGVKRFGGKTPVDWFHDAQKMQQDGHSLAAFLRVAVAIQFLRPAPFVHYTVESDIRELETLCRKELEKYSYPITLNTEPVTKLISINPQFYSGEVIPVAKYLSQIPLSKGEELREEAETLVDHLGALFPGFSSYAQHVAFKVYNELPTDKKQNTPSFDVVVPVKEKEHGSI